MTFTKLLRNPLHTAIYKFNVLVVIIWLGPSLTHHVIIMRSLDATVTFITH